MLGMISSGSSDFTTVAAVVGRDDAVRPGPHEVESSEGRDSGTSEIKETRSDGTRKDTLELSQEARELSQLQQRDREVRAHEAAHAAVGGAYAGSPSYSMQRGPDGKSYAVGGEVTIDISPVKGDPQATLQKAQQVRAAALAPAQPSAQDMKVAQRAQAMAGKARMELAEQRSESLAQDRISNSYEASVQPRSQSDKADPYASPKIPSSSQSIGDSGMARLTVTA